MKRIGVFGWGLVGPRAPHAEAFRERLAAGETLLEPFEDFGPSNFMVGQPEFDFRAYESWISERFPPNRFPALESKMGSPTQYAIGAFIQSLEKNPSIEQKLQELQSDAVTIIGGGLHDIPTYYHEILKYDRAQRTWNRFWSEPQNNSAFETWIGTPESERSADPDMPADPATVPVEDRDRAEDAWWAYWSQRSPQLQEYVAELAAIEGVGIGPEDVETAKASMIRTKRMAIGRFERKWKAPTPPWGSVTPNALWNIGNTPAAQISMMAKITGACYAPFAACATFGYSLRQGMDAIREGRAKLAVVGAVDPKPHPFTVGTFYQARILSADGTVSKPLTSMRGTHVSGGACVWIIGDYDYCMEQGYTPIGMEPVSVGISADADHLITPSPEGPTACIQQALDIAGVAPAEIRHWDLHATATPGDYLEVETATKAVTNGAWITARKGTFGHGMGAGGGWELTAQYMGYERGTIFPTVLEEDEIHQQIRDLAPNIVRKGDEVPADGYAGKLSMGVGGVNACIVSKPLDN